MDRTGVTMEATGYWPGMRRPGPREAGSDRLMMDDIRRDCYPV